MKKPLNAKQYASTEARSSPKRCRLGIQPSQQQQGINLPTSSGSIDSSSSPTPPSASSTPKSEDAASTKPSVPTAFAWHSRDQLTLRDACQKAISARHPGFTPRDDFELYTLGTSNYRGAQSDLEAWLKSMHCVTLHREFRGDLDRLNATYTSFLAHSLGNMVGLKPAPSHEDGVTIHSISDSKYALRLWPASPAHHMHCMDFIDVETASPVNTPSGFELWMVITEYLDSVRYQRLYSLENVNGYYGDAIAAGEEKFVLRGGMQYALGRPGKEVFLFTAPL